MGKNSPSLPPHHLPPPIYHRVYKRNAILCFPASYILSQAPCIGLGQAQKTWGGAAFYPFQFFFKKQMKLSCQLKNEHKNIKNSDDSGQAVLGRGKGVTGQGQGGISLPAVHQCPSLPSKKG